MMIGPNSPGDELPILIYFEADRDDEAAASASREVENNLTAFLQTYGLSVGNREESTGSIIIRLKAFGGLQVEFEIRLDILTLLSGGKAGTKDVPAQRKSAFEKLAVSVKRHGGMIALGNLVIAAASLISGRYPPKPPEPPKVPPAYVFYMENNGVVFAEVDKSFADGLHVGLVKPEQLKHAVAAQIDKHEH